MMQNDPKIVMQWDVLFWRVLKKHILKSKTLNEIELKIITGDNAPASASSLIALQISFLLENSPEKCFLFHQTTKLTSNLYKIYIILYGNQTKKYIGLIFKD